MSVTTVAELPRLALLPTMNDAVGFLYRERWRFVPAVLVISAVFAALQIVVPFVPSSNLALGVFCLGHLAVCACFSYFWCRLVLLNEWYFDASDSGRAPFTWPLFRGFFCYYALICVGIATLATVLALALAPVLGPVAGTALSGGIFSLLIARLSFVLPATALQLPTSFLESWVQTTGHGFRLWAIYACAAAPALGIIAGLAGLFEMLAASTGLFVLASFATWCVGLVAALTVVTMASIAYERMVGLPERARRLDRMVGG